MTKKIRIENVDDQYPMNVVATTYYKRGAAPDPMTDQVDRVDTLKLGQAVDLYVHSGNYVVVEERMP